jgi:hypothetical protein
LPSPFNEGTWRAPGSLRQVVAGVVRYNDLCLVASTGGDSGRLRMPLTVFDCKGIPASRRARIEGAVVAASRNLSQPYEAWIAADLPRGAVRVMITGPQGFDRTVTFDLAEDPAVITQRIRETIEDLRPRGCPVAVAPRAGSARACRPLATAGSQNTGSMTPQER